MNYFVPSPNHARFLREAMDISLWDSVRDMFDELEIPLAAPEQAIEAEQDPTHLLDYAAYFDLDACMRPDVETSETQMAQVIDHFKRRLAGRINLTANPGNPRIANFAADFYPPEDLDRMSRWWDTEPANRMDMAGVNEVEFERSLGAIRTAMDYLSKAAPDLHGEIEVLIRDIVLAKPGESALINYSGASSFGVWGAITINAETQCDWSQFYRQLVHETGHNLLFALARDEPLVKADPSIRGRSPIRGDPRPLDGIFHAAYVSAREALAFESLLQWRENGGELPKDDADIIVDLQELSVIAFWDCIETLSDPEEGATDLGMAILADCKAYMTKHFALERC